MAEVIIHLNKKLYLQMVTSCWEAGNVNIPLEDIISLYENNFNKLDSKEDKEKERIEE